MNTPSHEDVAQRAYKLWQDAGSPDGRDTEMWFEAEHQLTAEQEKGERKNGSPSKTAFTKRVQGEMASESEAEFHISPPMSEQEEIKAALQKKEARAPKVPHTNAPKVTPPQSGKPVWDKPHSA